MFYLFSLFYSAIYNKDYLQYFPSGEHLPVLAILVSEWCPHCHHSTPIFEEIESNYSSDTRLTILRINCDKYNEICKKFPEQSTPGIFWVYSDPNKAEQYQSSITFSNIKSFIEKHLGNTFIDIHDEEEFQRELEIRKDNSIFVYQKDDDETADMTSIISLIASNLGSYPCYFFMLQYKQNKSITHNHFYNYNLMTKKKIDFDGEFTTEDLKKFIMKYVFPPFSVVSHLFFDNALETESNVLLLSDEKPYFEEELRNMSIKFPDFLRTGIIHCGDSPRLCLNLLIQTGRGPQIQMYNPLKKYNYYFKDELTEDMLIPWINQVLEGKVRPAGSGAGFSGFLFNIFDNARRNGIVALTLAVSVFAVLILTIVFGTITSIQSYQRRKLYYSKLA